MEKFSFFNDVNDDRVYYAEDWARHLKKYFTNGIFNNELNVVSNNDMTITIKEGDANIEGYRYTNTGDLVKTIDNADGTLNRIDNVVLRLDLTNRLISAQIIKGTFADKPVAPELVRTSTIYDLRLAKISIPAGTTTITQDLITDTRFITSDCGNVISTVQTPDTENLFIQMQTLFEKQINELNNNFEIWFDSIKNQLDSDAAGNLQNQINNLNSNKVDNAKYDLDSNNLQLLANGKNVGDSVHIPGITDTATDEEDLKIVNNKGVVKFLLEGKTEQKTYTGKNLFYDTPSSTTSNGITLTKNSDGSFTLNGISTDVSVFNFTLPKVLLAGTYTFSIKGSDNIPDCVFLRARDNSMAMVETQSQVNGNNTTQNSHTFTCKKDISVVAINITQAGITFDNFVIYPQLEIGSKATEFEPYVGKQPSPNPNYPQKIENISGVENLLEINCDNQNEKGIELINNNDGSVTLNGTSTAKSGAIRLIKNNTSFSVKNLPSEVKFSLSEPLPSGVELAMAYGDENGSWVKNIVILKDNDISKSVKLDIPNNAKYIRFNFTIESGIVLNNITFRPLLEKGNKQHYFVPNGSNYLQLENKSKNILPHSLSQGSWNTTSTNTRVANYSNILIKPGTYTFSTDIDLTNYVVWVGTSTQKFPHLNWNEVNEIKSWSAIKKITFTIEKESYFLVMYRKKDDSTITPDEIKNIKQQLEIGPEATEFEPYQKKIINIDLKGNNLCSNKDKTIKDELVIENGKAKINKKFDEYIFTGNEIFSFADSNTRIKIDSNLLPQLANVYIPQPKTSSNRTPSFCTHYILSSQDNIVKGSNKFAFSQWSNQKFIYFPADYSTIEEFKAKLKSLYDSGNPVKVQYQLAEPKVIDLGEIDFELLEGNSTLNLEEDLKSNMSIKYYIDSTVVDLKKKVENKQNVILHGTTIPSNDLGEDGDIYLQHN